MALRFTHLCNSLGRAVCQPCSVLRYSTALKVTDPSELVVERLDGDLAGTVVIGLNRPKAVNAFSKNLLALFGNAVEDIKHDSSLRAVILRSMAPGMFCAGADLKERATMTPSEVGPFVSSLRAMLANFQQLPVPTICAIDGIAVGGGMEMSLTCDIRIASNNAKLGLVETKLAIIPGGGGTQNITRLVGPAIAKELLFTGRVIDGDEAHRLGIVNHVVPQNEEGDAAYRRSLMLAQEIVPQGPIALRAAKQAINTGNDVGLATALTIEQLCYAMTIPTKDRIEGLTAFREKRKPQYTGE
ncbi:methylglutaconyl-CoA hydratase, mitochondrial-like [Watersipora subatra]|uniref:methylglutaconyl-CoA hydratase, mitochondrial-like n=1 Tax=Watersipora subatra TaxID=2589382 RepID=UPI00355BF71E